MKLEITEDGLLLSEVYSGLGIQTPMGVFGIAQRDDGIEVVFTPPGGKTRSVWAALTDLAGDPVFHDNTKDELEEPGRRVAAYIDGPRMGKAAKPIVGTISREEFARAYLKYERGGGKQDIEQLLNGGGFSLAELETLLGHPPQSWIEGKLEESASIQGDKLEELRVPTLVEAKLEKFDKCPTCGFGWDLLGQVYDCSRWSHGALVTAHQLYLEKFLQDREDKLEDRANPVLLVAEHATITPRDKLEAGRVREDTLEGDRLR